jgi:hypothetical protein
MGTTSLTEASEIGRYLGTGQHDALFRAWPGGSLTACARHGHLALRGALVERVMGHTRHAIVPGPPASLDVVAFTRNAVEPMVRGLFPADEQAAVLGRSVVFLTPDNIQSILRETRYLHTAWVLANLFLGSCSAPLLAADAPAVVGLSEGTTCYVSTDYFSTANRFDDFVVHEAAHIFHNSKRQTLGLREIRGREWPLAIAFGKRETFAYACEVYSRILVLGHSAAARKDLLAEVEAGPMPPDEQVDTGEFIEALQAAVNVRNGWKRILEACAP